MFTDFRQNFGECLPISAGFSLLFLSCFQWPMSLGCDALRRQSSIFNPFQNQPRSSRTRPLDTQGSIFHAFSSLVGDFLASFCNALAKRRNLPKRCNGQLISRFSTYLFINCCIIVYLFFVFFWNPSWIDFFFTDLYQQL